MKQKIDVTIKGVAPLLQHRFDDTKDAGEIKKSGRQYNHEKQAKQALYTDKNGNIIQPAIHIENSMIKAATEFPMPGKGKKTFKDAFKGGIFVEPLEIPHKIQEWTIDKQNVVVNRARITRARPRLDEWELDFTIISIDERLTSDIIKQILNEAGNTKGIGDYRPRYGRFEVIKFEPHKKDT